MLNDWISYQFTLRFKLFQVRKLSFKEGWLQLAKMQCSVLLSFLEKQGFNAVGTNFLKYFLIEPRKIKFELFIIFACVQS